MKNRLTIILGGCLVAILVVAGVVAVLKIDLAPEAEDGKRPVRERNFGEGIRVSQHGLYGIDLVSIGKAHMRKLRKGPFTIGAINELVLEDVSLALPEEIWGVDAAARRVNKDGTASERRDEPSRPRTSRPQELLSHLGINPGQLKMGGKIPRFSALAIRNLRVSRIVDGTNAVPWFAAARGEAQREGLKLLTGWSVEGGVTNGWKEAFLSVEPKLKLWTGP